MSFFRLGFDFSNLQSCTLYKKSKTFILVFIIMFITFAIIGGVFIALFISNTPINVNGVLVGPGDPTYESSRTILVSVFVGLDILFLSIVIALLTIKPKPYLYMDSNPLTNETFYYITKFNRNNEVYLSKDIAIIYNRFGIDVIKSKEKINEMYSKYIPWYPLLKNDISKIRNYKHSTVARIDLKNTSQARIYKFSNDINIVPISFTVTVGYFTKFSSSYQSHNSYYFELINRAQHFEIHPEIKKELHSLAQTM